MIPCRNTCVVDEGIALLTTAYRNQPNIRALLSAFLVQMQEIENVQHDVLQSRLIGTAFAKITVENPTCCEDEVSVTGAEEATVVLDGSGAQLDTLAKLVGADIRDGRSDAEFLIEIKARILANRSDGLARDLIKIAKLVVGAEATVYYSEPAPATVSISVVEVEGARTLIKILGDAKGGGVRLVLTYTSAPDENTFRYSSAHGASAGDGHGFTSTYGGSLVSTYSGALES